LLAEPEEEQPGTVTAVWSRILSTAFHRLRRGR
jgi:hypothetical protein